MKIAFYILQIADSQLISNPIHSQDMLDASSYPSSNIFGIQTYHLASNFS